MTYILLVMTMKKFLIGIISLVFFVPGASAYSAVAVMDADSERVLYSENGDKKYLIASTTKIMTALVTLNYADLDKEVEAGDEILKSFGSSIYLKPGEKLTIEDLLYGLMLRSGNDAALVLAKAVARSEEGFVKLMNDTAISIGMRNTTFSNPHGLDEKNENRSTVIDMCKLMVEAMKNEKFREITSTKKYDVKTNFGSYEWFNKNKLLTDYKYATGGKIGYTTKARHTFVSSATKDGKNLVIATFVDPDRFDTHQALYEEYFPKYKKYKLIDKDDLNIKYEPGYKIYTNEDFYMLLTKLEKKKVKREVEMYDIEASGKGDKIVGTVAITLDGNVIKKMNIYVEGKEIQKKKSLFDKIKEFFGW